MSELGIGAMLHILSGGSENDAGKYVGRKIVSSKHDKEADKVFIGFDDGVKIAIWDDGQSCCESRYITCDDDLGRIVGGDLLSIEVKEGPCIEGVHEVHEQVFIDVVSTCGTITFTTHNEHNGYYGGFGLTITEIRK